MSHNDYMRRRYAANRARGDCAYHTGVPALPGKTMCGRCVERYRRYRQARHQFAALHGQCVENLGHTAAPNMLRCAACQAKNRAAVHRSTHKARQQKEGEDAPVLHYR